MGNAARYRNARYRKLLEPIQPRYTVYISLANAGLANNASDENLLPDGLDFKGPTFGSHSAAAHGTFGIVDFGSIPLQWSYQHDGSATTSDYVAVGVGSTTVSTIIDVYFTIAP